LETGDDVVAVGAGGHHDDRDVAVTPDLAAHREAVDVRQQDVEEDDVGRVAMQLGQPGCTTVGFGDVVALALEGQPKYSAYPRIVLTEQDASAHLASIARLPMRSRCGR